MANRQQLLEEAWQFVISALYPPEAAVKVVAKRALASRYLTQFRDRVSCEAGEEGTSESVLQFQGDHSRYTIRTLALPLQHEKWRMLGRTCSCPFYSQWQTCSHVLTLTLHEEAQEQQRLEHGKERTG